MRRSAPTLAAMALLLAALAACTTPTRYAPAAGPGDVGYAEQRIEADRFRVSFTGGDGTTPAKAFDLALRRAAELTLEQGGRWFTVLERADGAIASRGPSFGVGLGGGSSGRGGGGFGSLGAAFGGDPGFTTALEIAISRDAARPTPTAYDARQVADALASQPPHP